MIRKASEKIVERFDKKFDADGYILVRNLINEPKELNDKGRVFAHTTVPAGSGIGYHVHHGDTEIYYVISGSAEYNDNGVIKKIETGDVAITPSGTGHGIKNNGSVPLEIIALILYS